MRRTRPPREEGVDVFPPGGGGLSQPEDTRIGVFRALLHQFQRGLPDGFGGAAAELAGGIDVSEAGDGDRHLFQDCLHRNGVAECRRRRRRGDLAVMLATALPQ
jgi:hypothetical protein